MPPENKEYLSLEEVAEVLGVTYQLIYRLVRTGELPASRLGKLYRVSRSDLASYLERTKREAASGGTCAACGTFYRSRSSLVHVCAEDGCEEPICFDCWNRRKVRKCARHGGK